MLSRSGQVRSYLMFYRSDQYYSSLSRSGQSYVYVGRVRVLLGRPILGYVLGQVRSMFCRSCQFQVTSCSSGQCIFLIHIPGQRHGSQVRSGHQPCYGDEVKVGSKSR